MRTCKSSINIVRKRARDIMELCRGEAKIVYIVQHHFTPILQEGNPQNPAIDKRLRLREVGVAENIPPHKSDHTARGPISMSRQEDLKNPGFMVQEIANLGLVSMHFLKKGNRCTGKVLAKQCKFALTN